jgi:copper chaperone CopZ
VTIASNVKQCLSTIKGIEAQLSSMALNSIDKEAQVIFHEATLTIEEIKKDLQYRVLELERLEPQYSGS